MKKVKLWLDDQINDPETPDRHPPEGWTGVATAEEAIAFLDVGNVVEVSLDHDLGVDAEGNPRMTGYEVANHIEMMAATMASGPIEWDVHSKNPVGHKRMSQALESADRFWKKHYLDTIKAAKG